MTWVIYPALEQLLSKVCLLYTSFAVNKLIDRGSLASRGIVTNVQDFIANVAKGLGL